MAKEFNAQAYSKVRNKVYGLKTAAKSRSAANTAKKAKKVGSSGPVYKTGLLPGGQPRNYATSKKGTITSID